MWKKCDGFGYIVELLKLNNMEKENFTFTKEKALQEVGNLIEAFKEMIVVNLGNDTYNVIGVPVTSIEQEIKNN